MLSKKSRLLELTNQLHDTYKSIYQILTEEVKREDSEINRYVLVSALQEMNQAAFNEFRFFKDYELFKDMLGQGERWCLFV